MREEPHDATRLVPVVHRVTAALADGETSVAKGGYHRLGVESTDAVAGFLALEGQTGAHGKGGDPRPCGLTDADSRARDSCHLRETGERVVEMMETVVHVNDIDGAVAERERRGIADDGEQLEAVTPRALVRPPRCSERHVERDDVGSRARQELCVHP